MAKRKRSRFPPVGVCDELRALAGPRVGEAKTVLRTSGADCWHCGEPIRHDQAANMVAELTAAGSRCGFVHAYCGPSQVRDSRSDRRAALRWQRRMRDGAIDMNAFLMYRSSPSPRGVVVLSSPSPLILANREDHESVAALMPSLLERGMECLVPPVLDSAPRSDAGWEVVFSAGSESLVVKNAEDVIYDGTVSPLGLWEETVQVEHECLLLYSHLGLGSGLVQGGAHSVLDVLAQRGFVCGLTAKARIVGKTADRAGADGQYEPLPPLG